MTIPHVVSLLVKQLAALQQVVTLLEDKILATSEKLNNCRQSLQRNEENLHQLFNQTSPQQASVFSFRARIKHSSQIKQKQVNLRKAMKRYKKRQGNINEEIRKTRQTLLTWRNMYENSAQPPCPIAQLRLERRSSKLALILKGYGMEI